MGFKGKDDNTNSDKDDSFEADSYGHVEKKLNQSLPKCLSRDAKCSLTNHFLLKKNQSKDSGKRVIRKRLSQYQIKASVLLNAENTSNNSNNNNNGRRPIIKRGKDLESNGNDRSNMSTENSERQSTYVLQAKVQHLLFEMKKIRQTDRDLLRKFYTISDTIDELKWMFEEKEALMEQELIEDGNENLSQHDSEEDPYEKDMLALENVDVGIEEDCVDSNLDSSISNSSVNRNVPGDITTLDYTPKENTDTLDSGLTKSLSSLSLSNSSSTMSYQMSATSSRSDSPTDSTVSSCAEINYRNTLSATENHRSPEMVHASIENVPNYQATYATRSQLSTAYYNSTYESTDRIAQSFAAAEPYQQTTDYISRKQQYHRSFSDIPSTYNKSYLQNSRANSYHSVAAKHSASVTQLQQRNNEERNYVNSPLRRSETTSGRISTSYKLLQHPQTDRIQTQHSHMRRTTSFQENTPSLQPWKYRFVPIDENETESKFSSSTFDSRRTNDRHYQNFIDLSRQTNQTLGRQMYDSEQLHNRLVQRRKISGTGSAGSLTSQSSSSDSSTSSLHSLRRKDNGNNKGLPGSYTTATALHSSRSMRETRNRDPVNTSYQRHRTTAANSVYSWVQSQQEDDDDIMYL